MISVLDTLAAVVGDVAVAGVLVVVAVAGVVGLGVACAVVFAWRAETRVASYWRRHSVCK